MKSNSATITRSCRYQVPVASSPFTAISGWVTRCSVITFEPQRRAHVLDEVGAVGEVVFFAHRRPVVADDILGERVGEVVPVLGVERTQIAVFDQFYRSDVGEPGVVTV